MSLQITDKVLMRKLINKEELRSWSRTGAEVSFVPTMGFLHEGHFALIERARQLSGNEGRVLVSIFVNPAQFDKATDLEAYPRDLESDLQACRQLGVDAVFVPNADEFYAADRSITIHETSLSNRLCGATRPGHFEGVCLVLTKLFSIIRPQSAVFGMKDYQQLAIVRRLVRDLDLGLEIAGVPTLREADGLAMSSRNARLTREMRELAPEFYRSLKSIARNFAGGEHSARVLLADAITYLESHGGVKVDYLEIVNGADLGLVDEVRVGDVVAGAVFFGEVRLIDNLVFGGEVES